MSIFGFYAELKKVVVNTKNGKDFMGVIWKKTGDCLILKDATWLSPDGAKKLDGEVIIFIRDIDFIQVVSA